MRNVHVSRRATSNAQFRTQRPETLGIAAIIRCPPLLETLIVGCQLTPGAQGNEKFYGARESRREIGHWREQRSILVLRRGSIFPLRLAEAFGYLLLHAISYCFHLSLHDRHFRLHRLGHDRRHFL